MNKIGLPILLVTAGILIGLYPSLPHEIREFISYLGTIIGLYNFAKSLMK